MVPVEELVALGGLDPSPIYHSKAHKLLYIHHISDLPDTQLTCLRSVTYEVYTGIVSFEKKLISTFIPRRSKFSKNLLNQLNSTRVQQFSHEIRNFYFSWNKDWSLPVTKMSRYIQLEKLECSLNFWILESLQSQNIQKLFPLNADFLILTLLIR